MAKYEYIGTVVDIKPVRTYGQRGIQSREFWCKEPPVSPNSKYENKLPFVVNYDPSGDKYNNIPQLDRISVGDKVKFSFTMRGREWTNPKDGVSRLFVDNKVCSRIEVVGSNASSARSGKSWNRGNAVPAPAPAPSDFGDSEGDDMPF